MKIRSIYDFMAYTNDKNSMYEVINPIDTSKLNLGDIISYVKCYSYDSDIDKIEMFNHTKLEDCILNYSELNTRILKIN